MVCPLEGNALGEVGESCSGVGNALGEVEESCSGVGNALGKEEKGCSGAQYVLVDRDCEQGSGPVLRSCHVAPRSLLLICPTRSVAQPSS